MLMAGIDSGVRAASLAAQRAASASAAAVRARPTTAQPTPAHDPVVTEHLSYAVESARMGGDPAYRISETLNDPALTQPQRDEYTARLTEIAGLSNHWTLEGLSVTPEITQRLRGAFEAIGDAWTDPATPELRDQVAASIARGVDSGRISHNDLFNLLNPSHNPVSDGARTLLTGITDASVLARLSGRLLDATQAIGLRGDDSDLALGGLAAAADVANMAAANGRRSAANAVVDFIGRENANGPVWGDQSLTDAMMALTVGDNFGGPEAGRSGFEVLSTLLNSATAGSANGRRATLDNLFAELVRSGDDRLVGGIGQFYGNEAGLSALGQYFDRNVGRLAQQDWQLANSGDPRHQVVQDFVRNVLLNEDYAGADATTAALGREITRLGDIVRSEDLGAVIGNRQRAAEMRGNAAETLGALLGSVQEAARQYIADGRFGVQGRVDFVRTFTDRITGAIAARGGPAGQIAGGAAVDAFWGGIVDRAENAARSEAAEVTGGLVELGQAIRYEMRDLGYEILGGYDNRLDLYYDGPGG